jgi:glutathione S-transferase
MQLIGSYLSPYVRKVLVCLDIKGVDYEIDPIVPYFGNAAFTALSPLRRVPVLVDGDTVLADSTVICEYLNERFPDPPLLPDETRLRARARWLEEYADSRLGEVIIWRLFNERVIKRFVWRQATDEAVVSAALERELPELLDYLEGECPAGAFFCGERSMADIAVASFFRNAGFAGVTIDAGRWPGLHRHVQAVLDSGPFSRLRRFEEICLSTPIAQHREALRAAGAPVARETLGTESPRRPGAG